MSDARAVHGDRYDYSQVVFVNTTTAVSICCPMHGRFVQTPQNHLAGKGCRRCASVAAGDRYRKSDEAFVNEARVVHGERYSYRHVQYGGANRAVLIVCPDHGEFKQSPSAHLRGQGCPSCGRDIVGESRRWTTADFIAAARQRFGERFRYDGVKYAGSWTPVTIVCPEHGAFEQLPVVHVRSTHGCPKCAIEATHAAARMSLQEFLERAKVLTLPSFDVVHSHSVTRLSSPGPRASLLRTSSG
ncbi:MAG: DUF723 domain-containing protein [Betaproteobacteria bacterium]|nr:DUF723 domain-containing protein [Betaproteobacteria bacterium]